MSRILTDNQERMLFDIYRQQPVEEKDIDDVFLANYLNPWRTLDTLINKQLVEEDEDPLFVQYVLTPSGERVVEDLLNGQDTTVDFDG